MAETVHITIEGVEYEVPGGANLLQVCLDLGLLIPHFCYHEALGPAGACRLCAVMVAPAQDKPARLEMACMARTTEGMVVSINAPYAKDFRRGVIEYLMLNHPHDCPVCDEGGECMLQDMTVHSQHIHRRTRFPKRTWENQYLGPLIHHEMNRCITCYRCVRFYKDYALGKDFGVFGSRNRVYFGRVRDGVLESEFSGNLVDVCPTGVFTNKRFREFYSRPWDLRTCRSVCIHCAVGCNVLPGARHDTLRRVKPAPNHAVNRFFMCDLGRYGAEFVNSPSRLSSARIESAEVTVEEALGAVAERLKAIRESEGAAAIVGIGSGRASLETNAALALLMRRLGSENVIYHVSDAEYYTVRTAAAIVASGKYFIPTLSEIEKADAVLSVGGDVTAEAPMVDLAIRQAIRAGAPYFVISPRAGKLDDFARLSMRCKPSAVSEILGKISESIAGNLSENSGSDTSALIASVLASAKRPLIVCSARHGDAKLATEAARLVDVLSVGERQAGLAYLFPAANSFALGLMLRSSPPDDLLRQMLNGRVKAVIAVESDVLQGSGTYSTKWAEALRQCEWVIALDSLTTPLTNAARITLPVLPHYLTSGTLVNYEGRAQRFEGLSLPQRVTDSAAELLLNLLELLGGTEEVASTQHSDVLQITADLNEALTQVTTADEGVRLRSGVDTPAPPSKVFAPQKLFEDVEIWEPIVFYGSESLSMYAPPIRELAPPPCVEIHPETATKLGWQDGQEVTLTDVGSRWLRVRTTSNVARDTVSVLRIAQPEGAETFAETAEVGR